MKVSMRFTIAIHALAAIEILSPHMKVTSELLASSVNTNPVVIRRIIGKLKTAGLVETNPGPGGMRLKRPATNITLLDIFIALDALDADGLFAIHELPNLECPVGRNIRPILEPRLDRAQAALQEELRSQTLADVIGDVEERLKS